jgi:hypothetical protein
MIKVETNMGPVITGTMEYELACVYESIESTKAMSAFNDLAFRTFDKGFGDYMDARSRTSPKSFHHVYEWNSVGVKTQRLFRLIRTKSGKNGMRFSYHFINSKKVAPIDPILGPKNPNPITGRFVRKSAVFRNKAFIMEEGRDVRVRPKNGRYIAFVSPNSPRGIAFSSKEVIIKNPGGKQVRYALAQSFQGWFSSGAGTKYLKASGAMDKPGKVYKRAGTRLPTSLRKASVKAQFNKGAIEAQARSAVAAAMVEEYGRL